MKNVWAEKHREREMQRAKGPVVYAAWLEVQRLEKERKRKARLAKKVRHLMPLPHGW